VNAQPTIIPLAARPQAAEGIESAVRIIRVLDGRAVAMALESAPFRSVSRPTFVRLPPKGRHGTARRSQ
jgi:hypothetical protein